MRTLWLPPLASEPNSLHGMRSRLVRELPDGRGLRQCPSDRTHATPGIHVAAYADRFALSYHLPVGVLRPLGLDLHLTRHSPVVLGQDYVLGGIRLHPGTAGRAVAMAEDFRRTQKLAQVRNLIEAEDHESAAGIYQELGMWKEAGEVRRNARRQIVTQVHVNVNDLVDQVRKAGIATDYTCPACGGHIRITGETTLATLRNCQYCGSVVQTTDLVDFLTKVVGYQ